MEPEIARRCPRCGASVRGSAFFCPQCGTPVKAVGAGGVHSATEGAEKSNRRQTDGSSNSSIAAAAAQSNSPEVASGVAPGKEVFAPESASEAHKPSGATAPRIAEEERHWKKHRIASAREAVGEKIAPRMEKLRHASNVMLDEAAYDPSLRFVLVAIVILALTLLLFLLHGLLR